MKLISVTSLFLFLFCFDTYSQTDTTKTNDSNIDKSQFSIRINNPIRWFIDEARVIISPHNQDRFGFIGGIIRPNDRLTMAMHGFHSNMELKFSRKGYLAGAYVKPYQDIPLYFNLVYRNSKADVYSNIEITQGDTFHSRNTFVERETSSFNLFIDYRLRLSNGSLIHEFYAGMGTKFKSVKTEYEDQSNFEYKIIPLDFDNGNFVSPTIHIGYNIGFNFK